MRTLLWKIRYRKFKEIFGFVPTLEDDDYDTRFAEQGVVEAKLSKLSADYRAADNCERTATGTLRKAGESGDSEKMVSARDNLEWYRNYLRRTKESFWYAYGLAKETGFTVRDKYTDYLPSEWR